MIARVAVFVPVDNAFDYEVRSLQVVVGARVWVPYGGRKVEGVVVALDPPDAMTGPLKAISQCVDEPPISGELVQLALWIADYYLQPIGEVMRLLLPAGGRAKGRRKVTITEEGQKIALALDGALEPVALQELDRKSRQLLGLVRSGVSKVTELEKAVPGASATLRSLTDKGWIRLDETVRTKKRRELSHDPFSSQPVESFLPPSLTAAQTAALAIIEPALAKNTYAPFVLHGVTGSGKTEVYLRAIAAALAEGKRALVLVPEISLTPQLAARFRGRFGAQVAVLHSGLSDAARADAFRRIQLGEVAIALGARSAVFAPLHPLGIVVVDEEHDPSFKQQEGVRYHGRDVAMRRARAANAVVLLGSATPSLETYAAATDGRLGLIELPERATLRPLPAVEVLDLKVHQSPAGGFLSARLHRAIAETLAAGEQSILFLNRRGFSTFILCKACGQPARCRDCSVTLTYHRKADTLQCHYCGFHTAPPRVCGGCGSKAIERLGYGTEQVEATVKEQFPQARVARLDRDTAEGAGLQAVLDGVRGGTIDIVVGTQMVTKGHDFPNVTLVGVVLADQGMGLPDFRATERTFQLLEQVAGRAGRGERKGQVIIQTYSPQHPAVTCARDHDFQRFVAAELAARRELDYPPYTRLGCVHVDGADPVEVRAVAEACAQSARAAAERAPADLHAGVVGPAEAPLSRLKGRTRWLLFVRARSARAVRTLVRHALATTSPRSVRLTVDIDPISML